MKPKLLIVEDDEEIRTQMKWALGQDYEVLLAEDRLAALEAFDSLQPDGSDSGFGSAASS